MIKPRVNRPHPSGFGGTQKLYKFKNEYGASVIRFPYSYGYNANLWELAVIRYTKGDKFVLDYETPITDDVMGHLSDKEVEEILKRIQKLPKEKT